MKRRTIQLNCLLVMLGLAAPVAAQTSDHWEYEIAPYLWAAGMNSTIRIGDLSASTSTSFSDIFDTLDFGASAAFEAKKGRWAILFDSMYVKVSDAPNNVAVKVKQEMYALAAAWRVSEQVNVDILGGARYNYVRTTLSSGPASRASTKDALDPYIGVRGQIPLSPTWSLVGYADVGTISGGDIAWQLLAGAHYTIAAGKNVKFGYRSYKIEYDKADTSFDNRMSGLYLGMGFRF